MLSPRLLSILAVGMAFSLVVSCRGKEGPQGPQGPQGPAGKDLVRPQQGYIQGVARGKDNGGNPFTISFRYSFYLSSPGTWQNIDATTREFSFQREDSLGIGYLNLSFRYNTSNNQASNVTVDGVAADLSQSPIPTYTIQQLPSVPGFFSGTTQTVSNVQFSGDSLTGRLTYIRPSYNNVPGIGTNTHPDTVEATFAVRLQPIISYGRIGGQ
uniref:Collagen-like protein n=1 Tax=uncultured Bacteroidota bacterium TaxID=152509 RepID=H5SGJ4_9BACT|nr:hypothetical protein HGMM_F25B04C23 [uncultured Bacteroidetes bacterium]